VKVETREHLDALRWDHGGWYWALLPQNLRGLWPLLTHREQEWCSDKYPELLKSWFKVPNSTS